jgi:hypothetical protein
VTFSMWWSRRALNALTEIWLERPGERGEINQATSTVDQVLSIDPQNQGESRDKGRRVLFVTPLIVFYRVEIEDRVVRVLDVRGTRRHQGG